jgi:hypothetical protein
MSWSVVLGFFTVVTTAPPAAHPAATASARPAPTSTTAPAPPPKPAGGKPTTSKVAASNASAAPPAPANNSRPDFAKSAARVREVRPPPPPPEPEGPPPNVKLTIVAPSTRRLWAMHVENLEPVPVRLVADAHLLSFDVAAPGEAQSVHCTLPADMRPSDDEDRVLILPPKRSYAETFDPRLYCFGVHETPALTAGATVVAHLGWSPSAKRHAQLHVLSPIEGVVPSVGAAGELVSGPFTIPADTLATVDVAAPPTAPTTSASATPPPPPSSTASEAPPIAPPPKQLVLELPARLDVERPADLSVTLRLSNEGAHPVTLLFRSEVVDFIAIGASGGTRCKWPSQSDTPIRELYTTVRPHQTLSTDVLLSDLCGTQFFDAPGLYVLRGELDTRRASGASIGLATFDGQIVAQTPMLVRVRAARDGRPRPRPTLE